MTKPIQIRNEDVVRDIREAAALTRRPITDIVGEGVRLVLERERRRTTAVARSRRIDEALAQFRDAVKGRRVPTDDDFYDEDGFPR